MRGGTSKALIFHASDLPADRCEWDAIFLSAMGSPDSYGRQLDGMGGGISSLSKVCVVGPSTRHDADVDFTFAQIAVDAPIVDYAGNCGNMSSAIGPFAIDEGLLPCPPGGEALVRIHNTNTSKIVHSTFAVAGGKASVDGDFAIDGVAGRSAPVRLDFIDPEGAKTGKALPTGHAIDRLAVDGFGAIEASLVDVANPTVFVRASDLHLDGAELPDAMEHNGAALALLEAIRAAASVRMGLAHDLDAACRQASQPKIAFLSRPRATRLLSGAELGQDEHDILCRMISMGRPHRAIPVTGALCLAAAARIPGTVAAEMVAQKGDADMRIGHPSGTMRVSADIRLSDGAMKVRSATIYRTARRLFQGEVLYADAAVRRA
jgi:2-methylaconitate cis-trans-isomerase PrpF